MLAHQVRSCGSSEFAKYSVVAFCGVVSDCELLPELAPGADRVSSLVAMMNLHVGRTTPPVRNAIMTSFPQ